MTNQPLFSVLIANYNNGKYLMDAIESVRQQTYTNWEIILVDDGSIDNSHELYKELEQDERIHVFMNDQNHGCGYTKRRCAELANGEICGFLDPDDALTENALEVMVEEHGKREEIGLIYSKSYVTDEDLNILGITDYHKENATNLSYLECPQLGLFHFVSFKKNTYEKSGGIDSYIMRAVDHELYLRLDDVTKSHYVDIPLYYYRRNTGNNISLGINAYKAAWWDSIVKYEACKRRNLNPEKYAWNVIEEVILEVKAIAAQETADKVRQSRTYRIGMLIKNPFVVIKNALRLKSK